MIFYVTVGGMKGTTWVQIVKAVLLMAGTHPDHRPGAGEVRLQPLRAARRRRRQHRQGRGVPQPGPEVRRHADQQDRLRLPRPRAGARHRRPAAHPDPLLHRADRAGRPQVGAVGDRPDRRLLPDDAGARLRCRRAARHRRGQRGRRQRRQPGLAAARRGGRRRCRLDRRRRPAGADLGGRVRDDPRRGRRPDADLGLVGGARPLRQRDQEGPGHRRRTRSGSPGSRPS